ncbi:inosine-5'-monophosphate dehydrogenase [Candidatus Methanoplasma termitum]|uniref:GuaB1 protein n=1 Tax=Candidatus Methanoplasma termitum TaxID=1577791 RepID=A0A0A7LDX6_9ARCH|nr:CBS domain-containing protein [Candidatus Methanoplasma termitum]AIZ56507.1 inosine-5'-monophosphate dehydrogenase [Candidatus Methanoplasma termitum]MCL2333243.1 CBS domain-containing protein [Candidatus Methanoplasma sp.]
MKTVADIMIAAPIVVEVPGSRSDAINMMVRNKLTGLPVVRASDGKLMGIVSRRDIFRKFDEDQLSLIMKKDCITITPNESIVEAARIFAQKRIHRLPVIEDGKLVGIVTPTDLLIEIGEMRTSMTAEDAIRTKCVTAYEGEPLAYTVVAMRISDVSAVPVLDIKGKLVGILTDRDLFSDQTADAEAMARLGVKDTELAGYRNVLPLFYAMIDKQIPNETTVSHYMVKSPKAVFKKTPLNDVARIMTENDFGQLPVYGTKDELIGMIYDVDVLCALTGNINE